MHIRADGEGAGWGLGESASWERLVCPQQPLLQAAPLPDLLPGFPRKQCLGGKRKIPPSSPIPAFTISRKSTGPGAFHWRQADNRWAAALGSAASHLLPFLKMSLPASFCRSLKLCSFASPLFCPVYSSLHFT